MMWINLAKRFLAAYAAQDIETLESMVSEDTVAIGDWFLQRNIGFTGLEDENGNTWVGGHAFVDFMKENFKKFEKIHIRLKKTAYNNKTVFMEFESSHSVRNESFSNLAYNNVKTDYGVFKFELELNKVRRISVFTSKSR